MLRSRRGVSRAGVSKDAAARVLPRHRALADRQALGGTPRGRTPGARPVAAVRPAGDRRPRAGGARRAARSEEHTSELQSLMRISYAVFCLKKKTKNQRTSTDKKA